MSMSSSSLSSSAVILFVVLSGSFEAVGYGVELIRSDPRSFQVHLRRQSYSDVSQPKLISPYDLIFLLHVSHQVG